MVAKVGIIFFLKKTIEKFAGLNKIPTFATAKAKEVQANAEIAQLVEHNLAKVRVASSSLVFRSRKAQVAEW